jgi:hypothetical protein
MPETIMVVEPHSEYIARGCPTCHRGIEEGQTIVLCHRCHTAHHENCWFSRGGCGKVGCRGVASKRDQLGRPVAKTGDGPDTIQAVADPKASQLPIPVMIGIGLIIIFIAYLIFVR